MPRQCCCESKMYTTRSVFRFSVEMSVGSERFKNNNNSRSRTRIYRSVYHQSRPNSRDFEGFGVLVNQQFVGIRVGCAPTRKKARSVSVVFSGFPLRFIPGRLYAVPVYTSRRQENKKPTEKNRAGFRFWSAFVATEKPTRNRPVFRLAKIGRRTTKKRFFGFRFILEQQGPRQCGNATTHCWHCHGTAGEAGTYASLQKFYDGACRICTRRMYYIKT